MTIKGQGQMINGIWYLVVSDDERTKVQNQLKQHLEIK